MKVFYVLFVLSVFCPIYTYVLYPVILKLLKGRDFKIDVITPHVSAIVLSSGESTTEKEGNLHECDYENLEVIISDSHIDGVSKAKGEVILFTDTRTRLDKEVIKEIVKPFADSRVGAVIGQQTNPDGNSTFWKYENKVKELESRIGCVSGANESIFAVRRASMPDIRKKVLNIPFFIATSITQKGEDIVFCPSAKAYESKTDGVNFQKHVKDAVGYWQALRLFPKMLNPRKGSFVYVSHRVMKWFVWLDMAVALIISGILSFYNALMIILFVVQVLGYLGVLIVGRNRGGTVGVLYYFIMLNASYFIGLFGGIYHDSC